MSLMTQPIPPILLQDNHLLAFHKPAGLATSPPANAGEITLANLAQKSTGGIGGQNDVLRQRLGTEGTHEMLTHRQKRRHRFGGGTAFADDIKYGTGRVEGFEQAGIQIRIRIINHKQTWGGAYAPRLVIIKGMIEGRLYGDVTKGGATNPQHHEVFGVAYAFSCRQNCAHILAWQFWPP